MSLLTAHAIPVTGSSHDLDPLLDLVGDRSLVLLGEASHGTHDFYALRARITRRLVEQRGFTAVAVEADWPDAWRVNRWVRGRDDDGSADDALLGFRRFPTWMWRNTVVRDLVDWMRAHNARTNDERKRVGFYGIDLYSLHGSIAAVLDYLDQVDPEAAARARYRYGCFEDFGENPQDYGYAAGASLSQSCEDDVVRQLAELRQRAAEHERRAGEPDDAVAADEFFHAEQNARLVINAERYYRTMFRSDVSSWNLRDTHMADTLDALCAHLGDRQGTPPRVVVWAHNSHLGDARATEMGEQGELNVGQLVRERHGEERTLLVGFTTHTGTVTAASAWDRPPEHKAVRPSLEGSVERLLHETAIPRCFLDLVNDRAVADLLHERRLERAIGVIYRPESERQSHYFHAHVAPQFDALFHVDRTSAVRPLDPPERWPGGEVPETFPTGI